MLPLKVRQDSYIYINEIYKIESHFLNPYLNEKRNAHLPLDRCPLILTF